MRVFKKQCEETNGPSQGSVGLRGRFCRPEALVSVRLLLAASVSGPAVAQDTASRAASPASPFDRWIETLSATNVAISPDGQRLVYSVEGINWDRDAFEFQLWTIDGPEGRPRQLRTMGSNMWPSWSPDGESIVFLSDRDGGQWQLCLLPMRAVLERVTGKSIRELIVETFLDRAEDRRSDVVCRSSPFTEFRL